MFDEPQDSSEQRPFDPIERARGKSDEFRMHAELAAVFEAIRKFDAELRAPLDAALARECQQTMGKLEKQRVTDTPLLPPDAFDSARRLLNLIDLENLTTNDYHVSRRPGEVLIIRWLKGEQVETFYERLQAHFDAALKQFTEDERQAHEWRQDSRTIAFLEHLEKLRMNLAERYLRPILREHELFALSTQAADELDINYLCDQIMSVQAHEVVGSSSAPRNESEAERSWYFKLFSLRGTVSSEERMCFLAYLQKSGDDWAE